VKGDVTRLVTLTPEATSKLHALTKEKGVTVTQVVTALSALAHVEAYAKIALEIGDERFQTVAGAYAMATHYLVAINFINHVCQLFVYFQPSKLTSRNAASQAYRLRQHQLSKGNAFDRY